MGPCEPWNQKQIYFCAICGGPGGTRHHLVPKLVAKQRKKLHEEIIRTCRKCHDDIHFYFSHYELAEEFNTEDSLRRELRKRKSHDSYSKTLPA